MQKDLGLSLDAFLEAKRFRDGVIHANIFDEETAIGHQRARDTLYEVLLHRDALQWLTNTCLILSDELRAWRTVLVAGWRFTLLRGVDNQERSRLAEAVLISAALARKHRPRRVSLGPVPKFPDPQPDNSDAPPN